MLKWIPYAMVRVAALFIGGILLGIYQPELIDLILVERLAVAVLLFYIAFWMIVKKHNSGLVHGSLGLILIFLLGYIHVALKTDARKEDHILNYKEPIQYYKARIKSSPEAKAKSWKVELEIESVKTNQWQPAAGKVLAYISNKTDLSNWRYEDELLIKGSPAELRSPANPGEFDFKRFLTFKNIYHQHYITSENIKWIAAAESKGFIYYSHEARKGSAQKIYSYIHGEQERAIAMALILGVTDGIDNEVLNAYAASGAMHVLAVSGMHVGIIYAIILFLLKPLQRYSWGRWLTAGISLLFLWMFAFVTGLTPSVLRAVTMFSFIVIARPFNRGTNIYNTLAASAFVLLIYNPFLIMSVGFQLSYLAVLGIVYLQKPVYNLWEIENRVGDWIWQITCISLVAQVATFSLGLLYFHQFPVYFLVSNLFVIPISTLVLLMGILLLAVSFIPYVNVWIGKLTEWTIQLLNWTVFKTEQLPYSLITDIHLNTFQCWLLMIFIIAIIFIFQFRSSRWLYAAFGIALVFTITQWIHFYDSVNNKKWIVYSVNGHRAMEWIDAGQSYFSCDSALLHDEERIRFHIRPYRQQNGITQIHTDIPFQKEIKKISTFNWDGNVIACLNNKEASLPQQGIINYLVVSNNSIDSWDDVKKMKPDQVIFDGSNSRWWVDQMMKKAVEDKILAHSVFDQGAFIITY